jgi:ABC-2 type transport system ATP-binding protein
MLDLIRDIRDRGETHILLSSHLLADVESVCDEVLILKQGRVAACCNLAEQRQANRSFVELELTRSAPGFGEALVGLGCEVALSGDRRLKLVMPASVAARDLFEIAARHQTSVRRLDCKRDSLQDIFLRAMEDDRGGV